jgi:hypothetical protein
MRSVSVALEVGRRSIPAPAVDRGAELRAELERAYC